MKIKQINSKEKQIIGEMVFWEVWTVVRFDLLSKHNVRSSAGSLVYFICYPQGNSNKVCHLLSLYQW